MFGKKKNFWILTGIFTGILVLRLLYVWSTPQPQQAVMMTQNMSTMMKMHAQDATIYDLLKSEGSPQDMKQMMGTMNGHHSGQGTDVKVLGFFITAIIFLLLPLIIGGAVILCIVWLK